MYYLFSQDLDRYLLNEQLFSIYDINEAVKRHLEMNVSDVLELRFISNKQNKILAFYENNPINGKPCKCIFKGCKTFYKRI